MPTVKFNDVDEFLTELKADAEHVDRDLIRITFRHRAEQSTPFRSIAVIASAVIGGHVVTLEARSGTFFGGSPEADTAKQEAQKAAAAIEAAAKELGMEVRAGVFEAA